MFFRSVVGKLWVTIIAFVAVLFLILSFFIFRYFEGNYSSIQKQYLYNLEYELSVVLSENPDIDLDKNNSNVKQTLKIIEEIINSYGTILEIADVDENGNLVIINSRFSIDEIGLVSKNIGEIVRITNMSYTDLFNSQSNNYDYLGLAYPLYDEDNNMNSALVFYQSLSKIHELTNDLRKLLLIFVLIASVFTTSFSFFLSYRITSPVRQMQKAAIQFAKGDFRTRVKIRTSDEIGDLAVSFNQMASRLEETVLALSSEKEKLANVISSMADSVITLNTKGEIIMINPPGENLLLWEKKPPEFLLEMLKVVLDNRSNINNIVKLNGKILSVIMTPLFFGEEVNGAVTLLRDVTYEQKLNKLRQDFLENVSHELRTPISMIQGYSEAIIDDIVVTSDDIKELTNIIYEESVRIGRLVNELLDLAGMDFELNQLQYGKIDIKKLIDKVIKKFLSLENENNITLVSDYETLPEMLIEIDIDRIEQVLTNLVDNAFRHTLKDGKIIIRAKLKSKDKILIEVEDSGEGIPEEDIPYVFERFYKADKARTRGHSGMGLGLSIVKNIIDSHDGNISVTSKKDNGTTFSIILPIDRNL